MSVTNSKRHDFKGIGSAIWQIIDEQTSVWMQMTAVTKTEGDRLHFFLCPVLKSAVPKEIAALLEVARGAMIYGWYFYPLLTLGTEQCWRVQESGSRMRCQQAGIPTTRTGLSGRERNTTFNENVEALLASNLIANPDKSRWYAVRSLRNSASHPSRQMILDPGQAQGVLETTVGFLNDLFS